MSGWQMLKHCLEHYMDPKETTFQHKEIQSFNVSLFCRNVTVFWWVSYCPLLSLMLYFFFCFFFFFSKYLASLLVHTLPLQCVWNIFFVLQLKAKLADKLRQPCSAPLCWVDVNGLSVSSPDTVNTSRQRGSREDFLRHADKTADTSGFYGK